MPKRGQKGGRGSRLEKKGGEGCANDLHYTSKHLVSAVKIEVDRKGRQLLEKYKVKERQQSQRDMLTSFICLLDSFLS